MPEQAVWTQYCGEKAFQSPYKSHAPAETWSILSRLAWWWNSGRHKHHEYVNLGTVHICFMKGWLQTHFHSHRFSTWSMLLSANSSQFTFQTRQGLCPDGHLLWKINTKKSFIVYSILPLTVRFRYPPSMLLSTAKEGANRFFDSSNEVGSRTPQE